MGRATRAAGSREMGSASVLFHGDLQELLPRSRRGGSLERSFDGTPAVKDVLESLGVPHPEIGVVLVDGRPVDLDHRLRGGERVDAYGHGRRPDRPCDGRDGPAAPVPEPPRFVLDGHLGRLAAYLRALGFDTRYDTATPDDELAAIVTADPGRILLSRDVGLLKRRVVRHAALVRADDPHDQLVDIASRFDLLASAQPFTRCMRCNGVLVDLDRAAAEGRVPPRVLREQSAFRSCPGCGGVYWRGSHHRRLWQLLTGLLPGLHRESP